MAEVHFTKVPVCLGKQDLFLKKSLRLRLFDDFALKRSKLALELLGVRKLLIVDWPFLRWLHALLIVKQ